MYVAMNHFLVAAGRGGEFEERWRNRKSFLDQVPGFVSFQLLRGDDDDDGNHRYASHTLWDSEADFRSWTESDAFSSMPSGNFPLTISHLSGAARCCVFNLAR